jgi:predicted membrane-bound spermidine synthase
MRDTSDPQRRITTIRAIVLLSFLSGAAGLIYEVLWARRLALVFGSTAIAQTTVLSVFLGGLAAGSAFFGRAASRAPSATRFYARLEWGVAFLGLAAPLLLRAPGGAAGWLGVAGLFASALLMGGTIPALCRAAGGETQGSVGLVYASNSAGAVAGCLGAGFCLIPVIGLDWSFTAAAGLNMIAALAAAAAVELPPTPMRAASRDATPAAAPLPPALIQGAVFLSGFVALTYEIAWTRLLALTMGSSVYSFTEMLAAFITGSTVGSLLVASGPMRRRDPARLLCLVQFGAGIAVLATLPFYEHLKIYFIMLRPYFSDGAHAFYLYEALKFALSLAVMLAPAICLGMALPLAVRLIERGREDRAADVGRVFAANTAGNMAGAFAGWLILPWLGVEGILRSGTTVFIAVGFVVFWTTWPMPAGRRRALALAGFAALAAYRAWLPRWNPELMGQGYFRVHANSAGGSFADYKKILTGMARTIYARDDREATVTVSTAVNGTLSLRINGKTDASTGVDMKTQILLGELPMLLKPGAHDALLIGWGSGVTAGSMLRHPLSRLDAVELIPAVVDASRLFSAQNGAALDDPRLSLTHEDAKTFLLRPGRRYDVIVSEPSNPWMAGIGDLFSVEFYGRARARLAPGGIMVQWFHAYEMNDELFSMVLRTFRSSFPNVTVWNIPDNDILLVGSVQPLRPDCAAMDRAFDARAVREDMRRVGVGRLSTLLAAQSAGEERVLAMSGSGPLNVELRPRLEYGAPKAFFHGQAVALADAHDERVDTLRRDGLLLALYARARGRPLSSEEYMDLMTFPYGAREKEILSKLILEWKAAHPRDPTAAETARMLKKYGKI